MPPRRRPTTWKETERAVAKRLGTTRFSKTALGSSVPDVVAGPFAIETKHRKLLPSLLWSAMLQAVTNAIKGQTPVVVLHQSGKRHDDDFVIMRLGDFENWFGKLNQKPEGENPRC